MRTLKLVLILDKCMNMKTKYGILLLVCWLFFGSACNESDLTPEFIYNGPIPAIADGPSEAQKICYELYQKYDHHVYYTLSGDDALRTNVGTTQTNMIEYNYPDALPLEAADEDTAGAFLKLFRDFYAALPEAIVKTTVIKRQVLIKENIWYDNLSEYVGYYGMGMVYFYLITHLVTLQPIGWKAIVLVYCLPEMPADYILCILAAIMARRLHPMVQAYL